MKIELDVIRPGDRVRALYPNARLGVGEVVAVTAGAGVKPVVAWFRGEDGRIDECYFHLDQVEVVR